MKRLLLITATILSLAIIISVGCGKREKARGVKRTEVKETKQKVEPSFKAAPTAISTWRALSLRVLDEQVKKYMVSGEFPDDILKFFGVTKVHGFVVDEGGTDREGDVILVGETDAALPPLYLDDFVIALRNAWWKYAKVEG